MPGLIEMRLLTLALYEILVLSSRVSSMVQSPGIVTNFIETTTQFNSLDSEIKRKNDGKKDAQIFIPENYSIHEPPPTPDGGATRVDFYILLVDIRDIDEVQEELTLEFNLQMHWKDARLNHLGSLGQKKVQNITTSYGVLNPQLIQHIWHPDIFIDHVKKIEQPKVISPPASLRVYYKDGTFRYSGRFNMKIACQMVFQYYPADTQRCKVAIKSYSYSNETLFITWHKKKKSAVKYGLRLPNFAIGLGNIENFGVRSSSGVYSGIRFAVILRRHLGFHLIQTYLPSCLFVIVSFLTFLVSHESVLECMTLCMTTLLTLTAMFAAVKQNTPSVSYVKGLDIWMVTCIFCVFFTLLEHTVLLKLRHRVIGIPVPSSSSSPSAERKKKRKQERDAEKTVFSIKLPGRRRNKAQQAASQEPLTPYYHKCTSKCKTCSSGSCSGSESSPVLQIRRSTERTNGHLSPNANTAPTLQTNMLPLSLSPIMGMGLGPHSRSASSTGLFGNLPMTPSDTFLLSAAVNSTLAMTPKDTKRFQFSRSMEMFFSKLIPISFVVFNCIYWPWLLLGSGDYYNDTELKNTNYA